MEVTCDQLESVLSEMLDGTASAELEEAAASHLATCDSCRIVVDETSQVRAVAREYGRLQMPEDVKDRVRAHLVSTDVDEVEGPSGS